jgi:uncharacterized lipoprotein YddW (UPF0748 family)
MKPKTYKNHKKMFANFQDTMQEIMQQAIQLEQKVIIQVLTQLLEREPTKEDFKKVTRFFLKDENNFYYLAYENKKLGTIKRNFPDHNSKDSKYTVDFIPLEYKDMLEPAIDEANMVTF